MAPSNVENFSPNVIKQISRELCELSQNPLEGVRVVFNEDDITSVHADIDGPSGTPYYGGSFRIRLVLGKAFPSSPPKGFFVTKIFHPNVGRNGEICVNTLKKDWNQDLGIKHILLTIKCLLIVPNPESALNEEAGKMILEQYDDYYKRAKMMTEIHAPRAKIAAEYNDECHPQSSSSSSIIISNNNNNSTTTTNSSSTLNDKTASTSTNIANTNPTATQGQKQALDGVCCSEEPVSKRLNTMLDSCFNTSTSGEQQQANNGAIQQKSTSSQLSKPQSGTTNTAISNKNRGLKRVLRLRS